MMRHRVRERAPFIILPFMLGILGAGRLANAQTFAVGLGIGYIQPTLDISRIGDEFFWTGAGAQWKDLIGLKAVKGTVFLYGDLRLYLRFPITFELSGYRWSRVETTHPSVSPSFTVPVHNRFQDLALGLNVLWSPTLKNFRPFVGVGASFHHLRAEIDPEGFPEIATKGSKQRVGPALSAGVDWKVLPRVALFITGRYDVVVAWNQWKILGGIRFHGK
jgi:hypothetical protein